MLPYSVNYVGAGDLNSGPCVHTDSIHLSAKLAARSPHSCLPSMGICLFTGDFPFMQFLLLGFQEMRP